MAVFLMTFCFALLFLCPKVILIGLFLVTTAVSLLVTGSIARSAKRRYLSYSEAYVEGFVQQGRHTAAMGVHWCNGKGIGPPKLKFLLIFYQSVEYKRPTGAYPLRDFYNNCRLCTPFQHTSAVKILLDLLKGIWSYGGFKLTESG